MLQGASINFDKTCPRTKNCYRNDLILCMYLYKKCATKNKYELRNTIIDVTTFFTKYKTYLFHIILSFISILSRKEIRLFFEDIRPSLKEIRLYVSL